MSCCGNKKDVNQTPASTYKSGQIKATKFYGNDLNPEVTASGKGFVPIRQTNVGSYTKKTKEEDYARENTSGSTSRLLAKVNELNFALDSDPGVSNTFDIPTFDYQTMLTHNIFYNLNRKVQLNVDDGNRSTIKQWFPWNSYLNVIQCILVSMFLRFIPFIHLK